MTMQTPTKWNGYTVRAVYPGEFYVAHALFTGLNFPAGGVWGDITDGPADWHGLRDAITEAFDDEAPELDTLRVWHFPGDVSPRDVTEDVLGVLSELWPVTTEH